MMMMIMMTIKVRNSSEIELESIAKITQIRPM